MEGKGADNLGGTGISSREDLSSSWNHQSGAQLLKMRGRVEVGDRRAKEKASTGSYHNARAGSTAGSQGCRA